MEGKLSQFLEKYKNLAPPDETIRKEAEKVIKKTIGVMVDKKDISVKNGTIYISSHPAVKNKILVKKDEILGAIRDTAGKNPPTDLR